MLRLKVDLRRLREIDPRHDATRSCNPVFVSHSPNDSCLIAREPCRSTKPAPFLSGR